MAGEPIMELDAQFCFQRFGIDSWPDAAEQVEPIRVGVFQTRRSPTEERFGGDGEPYVRHAAARKFGSIKARRSDADHCEEMAVHLVAATDNGRIQPVFI